MVEYTRMCFDAGKQFQTKIYQWSKSLKSKQQIVYYLKSLIIQKYKEIRPNKLKTLSDKNLDLQLKEGRQTREIYFKIGSVLSNETKNNSLLLLIYMKENI